MIVQQINLYQDRFKEKRLWVSASQVAAAFLVVIVAGALWSYLLHDKYAQVRVENQRIKADRDQATADLAVVNAELARLLDDQQIDQDIASAVGQISARKKVLRFVEANQFGSGRGFSSYLVALSSLHIDDIWLTRVRFAEDFVQIEGSALSAEQIPGYFDRFSEEDVFQGNRFDLFQLSRLETSDWKVDFEIATSSELDE